MWPSPLEEWYDMWRDDTGERRSVDAAWARYERWRADEEYATIPLLWKMQRRMDDAHFTHLSPFLRDPLWEGTNNGAERMGRTFRHLQTPRFGLRTDDAREGALVAHAMHRGDDVRTDGAGATRCTRGRKPAETTRQLPRAA